MAANSPRVFISYSHDSRAHAALVLALAQELRRRGIDAELDQFHQEELQHWPSWCEERMRPENADFVLCICTETYRERVENKAAADVGNGVFWEGRRVYNEIYRNKTNRRFVPVLFATENELAIPEVLEGYTWFRLDGFDLSDPESGYARLFRLLTRQARVTAAALGDLPSLPPLPQIEVRTDFMGLIEGIRQGLVAVKKDTAVIRGEQVSEGKKAHGRHRRLVWILLALTLVVALAGGAYYWQFVHFVSDPKILRTVLAEQIETSFQQKLAELKVQQAQPAEIDELYRLRDLQVDHLDQNVAFIQATADEARSTIVKKAARILQERGVDAAMETLEQARAEQGRRLKAEQRELAEAALFEAELRENKLDFDGARNAIEQAIEMDYRSWKAHNRLGLLTLELAQWDIAEREFKEAERFVQDESDRAVVLNSLAAMFHHTNRFSEAEPLMRRALEIDEKGYGPEHPKVAIRLSNLAVMLQATNRLNEAEPLMRRAIEIDEKSYGTEHPVVATGLNNLAQLLQATNRLSEAEPLMKLALAIDEKSYGLEHPNVATDVNNLALLMQATNRLKEAEPLMKRALAIDEKSYGPEHPDVARDLNNLALLLQDTNRLDEAEPVMRRALAISEKSFGPEHPKVAICLNNLAALLQATNRLDEAEPLMKRAFVIDEKSYGPEHPKVAIRLNNLAVLLIATNRLDKAEPLMRRHVVIFLKFTKATGHAHPHLRAAIGNYRNLLVAINIDPTQIAQRLVDLGEEAGFDGVEGREKLASLTEEAAAESR